MNRSGLYVAGWLLAAGIATTVGFAAVAVVAEDVAPVGARNTSVAAEDGDTVVRTNKPSAREDREPTVSDREDPPRKESGREPDRSSKPPGGSDDAAANRPLRTQVTDGGTASARCTSESDAVLSSWSPRSGWSVLSADPGPSSQASVAFTDDDTTVTVRAVCVGVEPLFSVDVSSAAPTPGPTNTPSKTPTSSPSVSATR